MKRNFFSFLIVGGLIASLYINWNLYNASISKGQALDKETALSHKLEDELRKERRKNETEVVAQREKVSKLKQDLTAKKVAFEIIEQKLRTEKNLGVGGEDIPTIEGELSQRKAAVQDLEQQLKGLKGQQAQVTTQGKAALAEAKATQKLQLDQLAEQIRLKEVYIKELTSQIAELKKQHISFEAQQKAKEMEPQLTQEKANLDELKTQRRQINDAWLAQLAESQGESETGKSGLVQTEQQLKDDLQAAKTSLQESQARLQGARSSKTSQAQVIRGAEEQYKEEKASIQEFEAQLQLEQQRLKDMEN